jgi:hypothetical protein
VAAAAAAGQPSCSSDILASRRRDPSSQKVSGGLTWSRSEMERRLAAVPCISSCAAAGRWRGPRAAAVVLCGRASARRTGTSAPLECRAQTSAAPLCRAAGKPRTDACATGMPRTDACAAYAAGMPCRLHHRVAAPPSTDAGTTAASSPLPLS